jgi:hypothetical protein
MPGAIALFTFESVSRVLERGGTGSWSTKAARAREYPYVVLVRNKKHPSSPADVDHRTAFLVGRISDAREVPASEPGKPPRVFIELAAYALTEIPKAWSKSQNPVWYTDLATLGIDENELQFKPMLAVDSELPEAPDKDASLAEIKQKIAALFGVRPSSVEIAIRM